ncbi:methyltransferase domain-containing protein [Streptomyces sp. SID8382]|uniref:class I SAM-dependent methyltransferase n=2 Tax=Streptomyces malaysiensis TaxID=92644 RepID=UPI000C2B6771|nr:bifunctional 3-demethylubiquinone-9 3-methyltransferase/ 2-octaprenyl-6-hydroxy phenol methylase [Streptomyces sp. M56]MYX62497.1 methyltransferase domain-containing protein [Streptomyces sp. SID8382]
MGEAIAVHQWDAHYAAGRDFRPVMDDEAAAFARHVGTGNGRLALDIGCGTGGFSRHLHGLGYNVLGVDCAETAIAQASAHCDSREGVTFQCWDAENDDWENLAHSECNLITTRLSYAFIQNKTAFVPQARPPPNSLQRNLLCHDPPGRPASAH